LSPVVFIHNYRMNESIGMSLGVIMAITGPFIVVGMLFVISSRPKKNYTGATALGAFGMEHLKVSWSLRERRWETGRICNLCVLRASHCRPPEHSRHRQDPEAKRKALSLFAKCPTSLVAGAGFAWRWNMASRSGCQSAEVPDSGASTEPTKWASTPTTFGL
jgi:hypothetical protein